MRPRHLVALVTAGLLLVVPAGCGIPDQTDVRVDGGGQELGSESTSVTGREPPGRTSSNDVEQFVANFLMAAAGEASTADDRVREFYLPDSLRARPDQDINVVRLIGKPNISYNERSSSWVTITVQQVGVLGPDGVLSPPVLDDTSYRFQVGTLHNGPGKPEEAGGLYVYKPLPDLLMNVDALNLNLYYTQQTIYFWSQDNARLVPDLRYLPLSVASGLRPTEVVSWLVGGPAEWLGGNVAGLPGVTKTIGNAPASGGRLVVNLAAPALAEAEIKRLATQLAWSLREIYPRGRLELMIGSKVVRVFDVEEQRRQNPLYRVESQVTSYCLLAGGIYRVSPQTDLPAEPAPIVAAANRDLAAAALTRDGGSLRAALVTTDGRLLVGTGNGSATDFSSSDQHVGRQARPVWLRGFNPDSPVGLVVANGQLHRFGLDGQLTRLQLMPAVPGTVTAVSAAEDGRRIAFIADGRLFVASLNAATLDVVRVRAVPLSVRRPTAVAWIAENDLVVAGQNSAGNTALVDVTVDGAVERQRLDDDLGQDRVGYLAAYPYNPVRGDGPLVMYEANGAVWSGAAPSRVEVDQLQGVPATAAGARPTAPFFLY